MRCSRKSLMEISRYFSLYNARSVNAQLFGFSKFIKNPNLELLSSNCVFMHREMDYDLGSSNHTKAY
jgi:hypothetical protein